MKSFNDTSYPTAARERSAPEQDARGAVGGGTDAGILASVLSQTKKPRAPATPKPAQARTRAPAPDLSYGFLGFDGRCRITTNFGDLPIMGLRVRDRVRTRSGAFVQVQWVDSIQLDSDYMTRRGDAAPILVRAKALGGGLPRHDILVAPGQKLRFQRPGAPAALRRIGELDGMAGIKRIYRSEMTYYRFHCGSDQEICIEGSYFCISPDS